MQRLMNSGINHQNGIDCEPMAMTACWRCSHSLSPARVRAAASASQLEAAAQRKAIQLKCDFQMTTIIIILQHIIFIYGACANANNVIAEAFWLICERKLQIHRAKQNNARNGVTMSRISLAFAWVMIDGRKCDAFNGNHLNADSRHEYQIAFRCLIDHVIIELGRIKIDKKIVNKRPVNEHFSTNRSALTPSNGITRDKLSSCSRDTSLGRLLSSMFEWNFHLRQFCSF